VGAKHIDRCSAIKPALFQELNDLRFFPLAQDVVFVRTAEQKVFS
jgi:hypothetical protein